MTSAAIIRRQEKLGYNYDMTMANPAKPYKLEYFDDRLAFLHEFHAYAKANPGGCPML